MQQQYAFDGDSPGRALVEAGTDIAGSVAGTAVGLIFAGPEGALAGAAAGPLASQALRRTADELGQRILGARGRARAGAAIAYAAERLEHLSDQGATVRDDGFFDDLPSGRNVAREVVEGVLLTAQSAYQERKVRHIGYLFANVSVLDDIDDDLAALALRRAESLSWRQYVLLATVARAEDFPLPPGELGDDPGSWTPWGARRELKDLYEAGYLRAPQKMTDEWGLPYPNTSLPDQRLSNQGLLMHHLLSLDLVPDEDLREQRRSLRITKSEQPQ